MSKAAMLCEAQVLRSPSAKYRVLELLGKGVFGEVYKCSKLRTSTEVAIKVVKNDEDDFDKEMSILLRLKDEDPDEFNFVRAYEYFLVENYGFFVFEILNQTLQDYLKQNNYSPLPLCHIRPILQQVSKALLKFSELGIIHCDLNLKNIMFVDHLTQPFRIKVIDFGYSTHKDDPVKNTYVQTRFYRAPEVILGAQFSKEIDMWSLGCIAAELFLGTVLYPGHSEFDQIRYIVETQGFPPPLMLEKGTKTSEFFFKHYNIWRLKTVQEYEAKSKSKSKETRSYIFDSLSDIEEVDMPANIPLCKFMVESCDRRKFIHLLKRMLNMEPAKRLSPGQALDHPFISLTHLAEYHNCNSAKESVKMMEVCKNKKSSSPPSPPCPDNNQCACANIDVDKNVDKNEDKNVEKT